MPPASHLSDKLLARSGPRTGRATGLRFGASRTTVVMRPSSMLRQFSCSRRRISAKTGEPFATGRRFCGFTGSGSIRPHFNPCENSGPNTSALPKMPRSTEKLAFALSASSRVSRQQYKRVFDHLLVTDAVTMGVSLDDSVDDLR